ncbi:hypothetical protein IPC432_13090 [Pseudomonas aeruginosa]|nr:hypothetical protein IPC432_13090 [Pseudomonas aeruginosa]
MVRANPQAWPRYEVRELAVIPEGHVVVSEGLLRTACFGSEQEVAKAMNVLRALLSEQEGGKQ